MTTEASRFMKEQPQYIEVQGIAVQLVFTSSNNDEVPALVCEVLKSSYSRRKTA